MNVLINDNLISDTFKNFIYSHEHELNKILKAIGDDFYPSAENVLRFARVNIKKIKVIILGMDPYPSSYILEAGSQAHPYRRVPSNGKMSEPFLRDGGLSASSSRRGELASPLERPVATGRSFEVANVDSWFQKFKQASLTNILKSLYYLKYNKEENIEKIRNEIKEDKFKILPPHEWFDKMEEEGVLFLNATLTVKKNKPNSHTAIWKNFMDDLIKYICDFDKEKNITWLLWGKNAYDRVCDALKDENEKPKIIFKVHPASRVKNDFVVNNGFSEIKNIKWV